MSKQNKQKKMGPEKPEIEKQTDYYKLKTQAVEDLVTADESNSPEVSEEELRRYRSGGRLKIADWVKLLFIKGWFAGAVCFFFIWGLGGYFADQLDLLVVTGAALGMVIDLMVNPVLRFFERTPGDNSRYMMFPKKGYISFPLNILYGYMLLALVYSLYSAVNTILAAITGAPADAAPILGVEPILFGVFCLGFDLLLIYFKHRLLRVLRGKADKQVQ